MFSKSKAQENHKDLLGQLTLTIITSESYYGTLTKLDTSVVLLSIVNM